MDSVTYPATQHYAEMAAVEWLEADGLGGIAMSTAVGANTRKQHGLLSVPDDRGGRIVLLAGLHDTVTQNGISHDLSTNVYRGGIHPAGYRALHGFSLDPWPVWKYVFEDFSIEKQIFMPHGEHTVIVVWELRDTSAPARLCVRPMMAFRGQHDLVFERMAIPGHLQIAADVCEYRASGDMPALFIAHPPAEVDDIGLWYRDFFYETDADSHLDCVEDLYHPARITFDLPPNIPRAMIFSTPSPRMVSGLTRYMADERLRRRAVRCASGGRSDSFYEDMLQAADALVVERDDVTSVLSGLPWGHEEPCVGLVAMPGLLLAPRYFDKAFEYLNSVAEIWKEQGTPACYPCGRSSALQIPPIDTPLWIFIGVWRYWKASGDTEGVQTRLLPVLRDIIQAYLRGNDVSDCDETGLIAVRDAESGRPLTYPLATNALWYNALMIMAELEADRASDWAERAGEVFASVARLFPCESRAGLADNVRVESFLRDETLRPCQVLALALPNSITIDPKPLVELVRHHLATPLGLRTLSPEDPAYVGDGSDIGTPGKRWSGSVDPAWFGLWRDAQVRAGCGPARHEDFAAVAAEMARRGLGHISGAFTGAAPHAPLDYVASAAGLAEVIRVYARDVLRMPFVT